MSPVAIDLTRHQKYLVASGQLSKLPANCLSERERWAFDINWHKRKAASIDNARSRVGLVPKLERPYSRLLAAIRAGERKFGRRTLFTAGHLVNLAGDEGRALAEKFGV